MKLHDGNSRSNKIYGIEVSRIWNNGSKIENVEKAGFYAAWQTIEKMDHYRKRTSVDTTVILTWTHLVHCINTCFLFY